MGSAVTTQPRTAAGQFDSGLGDEQLLVVIAEVARTAAPDHPAAVSQRAWNAALARSRHVGRAPSARACVMRLKRKGADLSWRQVVAMALRPPRGRRQALVAALRAEAWVELNDRQVFYAVRRVARELARTRATVATYDRGRGRVLRRRSSADRERLPTANQLVTWARAQPHLKEREPWHLESARLPLPRREAPKVPAGARGVRQRRELDAAVALAEFARANRRWASKPTLTAFCRDGGVALSRTIGKPWGHYIAEATASLRASGDPVPTELLKPTGRGNRITYVVHEGRLQAALASRRNPKPQPSRSKWSRRNASLRSWPSSTASRRTLRAAVKACTGATYPTIPTGPRHPLSSSAVAGRR